MSCRVKFCLNSVELSWRYFVEIILTVEILYIWYHKLFSHFFLSNWNWILIIISNASFGAFVWGIPPPASLIRILLMSCYIAIVLMFCNIVYQSFTECFMSKLLLKFWVEQSELMEQTKKNGGTISDTISQVVFLLLKMNRRWWKQVKGKNW